MLLFGVGELIFELSNKILVFVDEFVFLMDGFLELMKFFVELFGLGLYFLLEDVDLLLLLVKFFLKFICVISFRFEWVLHVFLLFLGSLDLLLKMVDSFF